MAFAIQSNHSGLFWVHGVQGEDWRRTRFMVSSDGCTRAKVPFIGCDISESGFSAHTLNLIEIHPLFLSHTLLIVSLVIVVVNC